MKTSPYAIELGDGRVADHLDYQNAEEQVRLYNAKWIDADAALVAISAQRRAERAHVTINAKDGR